jgi:CHAD domain-containing protein
MPKPDQSICVYGAGILKKNLEAFEVEIAGVRQAEDIEFIHRMRVASRRLRSALPLFINCYRKEVRQTWQDDIQAITRALGSARDADVQIDFINIYLNGLTDEHCKPGVRRLLLRLRQKRQKLQVKVTRALDRLEKDRLIESMRRQIETVHDKTRQVYLYSPGLYQLSFNAITVALEQFVFYEAYIDREECVEELHAMRIAAKRLRYTLELFTSLYPGGLKQYLQIMKQVQDLLGSIHDNDIWEEMLPRFIEEESMRIREFYGSGRSIHRLLPGLENFRAQARSIRIQKYNDFNENWKRWKKREIWSSLRQTVQTSFLEAKPPPPVQEAPSDTPPQEPAE